MRNFFEMVKSIPEKVSSFIKPITEKVRDGISYTCSTAKEVSERAFNRAPNWAKPGISYISSYVSAFLKATPEIAILVLAAVGVSFTLGNLAFVVTMPSIIEGGWLPWISGVIVVAIASLSDATKEARYGI